VWRFQLVAFFAIALSITGTTLAGVKQYFDPARAVVENERALLGLRQLHQDVFMAIKCEDNKITYEPEMRKKWAISLNRYHGEIISPYAPSSNQSTTGTTSNSGT
jgi:hypothetical protein